jgi:hypothetical protein
MSKLDGIVALAALLACLALFIRCTLFSGHQVRRMKWRTRLRLRPGAGSRRTGRSRSGSPGWPPCPTGAAAARICGWSVG